MSYHLTIIVEYVIFFGQVGLVVEAAVNLSVNAVKFFGRVKRDRVEFHVALARDGRTIVFVLSWTVWVV